MSTIFISYTGRDPGGEGRLWAERIHALLGELHYQDVFLDRHLSDGITAGTDWRQLLSQPAGRFSVHRLHADLRSQGFAIGKDTVHTLIDHLEAAYLLRTVPIASESIPA
jgi:hypothetical protein